jgi:hypothetical protein
MTVTTRHFLVDGDEIRPLTRSIIDRLRRGEARLPRYAGRDLHVVDAKVEVERRKPVRLREVGTMILSLDERGGVRSRLLEDLQASLAQSKTGRVPARAHWTLSQAQLARVTDLALGRASSKLKPPRATGEPGAPRGRSALRGRARVAAKNRRE